MRLKIIAGNLLAVLIVGLVSFFVVRASFTEALEKDVAAQTANDATLFDRFWRASSSEFLQRVAERAQTQQVRDVFGGLDETSRRRRAHDASNGVAEWFRDPMRGRGGLPAEIVAITDETGRVVARNQDPNRMAGVSLASELSTAREVLADGAPRHDVWNYAAENKLYEVGIAPIRNAQGGIIGLLISGYELSVGVASSEGQILGRDIAFVLGDRVYSSSLDLAAGQALQEHLAARGGTAQAVAGGAPDAWEADLAGTTWTGVTAPLPMSVSTQVGFVVLANKSSRLEIASSANIILMMLVVGVLLVLGYGFIVGGAFVKQMETIEEAVLAVINGRTDMRVNLEGGEFGGLAYRINQLINVFTGVSESDDEGRVEGGEGEWKDAAFSDAAATGGGAGGAGGGSTEPIDDPALAQQLSAEPEDAYYARIYKEYAAAKAAVGENVGNIPQDRFSQRLKGNAEALAKKHSVASVRFQVETRDKQVVLRPVLIR